MTREKAIGMALKIIKTCNKYGIDNRCKQCPFNIKGGCLISAGNDIPQDWELSNIMSGWCNYGEEVKE